MTFPKDFSSRAFSRLLQLLGSFCVLISVFDSSGQSRQVPAFPGAEGAGAMTPGGRGGRIIEVTTLDDSGPGSYRAALEAEGARIVVFRVAGRIQLASRVQIRHPFITIAGQTAPGDGVCIAGETTEINTHDVVIRYMRFRRGELDRRDDALGGYPVRNIIIDHCSASWGLDENISLYRWIEKMPDGKEKKRPVENVTIQWCISSEALDLNNHAFGGTWGGRNASFHHNLFANNTGRNPSIGYGDHVDFRNNVIFNWRHRTLDGGDASSWLNVVANYYKPGPATETGSAQYRICRPQHLNMFSEAPTPGKWFVAENHVLGHPEISANNWKGGVQFDEPDLKEAGRLENLISKVRGQSPFPAPAISQQTAEQAYELVLAQAGATLPARDAVDQRIIECVRTGQPTAGQRGIIRTPDDAGGWPIYRSAPPAPDADHDGMPDAWESKHGLNRADASDGARDTDGDGYTNVEEFLNQTDPKQFDHHSHVNRGD
jgi:pectate lyase